MIFYYVAFNKEKFSEFLLKYILLFKNNDNMKRLDVAKTFFSPKKDILYIIDVFGRHYEIHFFNIIQKDKKKPYRILYTYTYSNMKIKLFNPTSSVMLISPRILSFIMS